MRQTVPLQRYGAPNQVTGNYLLDVFREPHDGDTWVCRRDQTIRLPVARGLVHPNTAESNGKGPAGRALRGGR